MDDARDDEAPQVCGLAWDEASFTALVARYQAPLGRYLTRLTGDPELARDLTQEAFVRAYTLRRQLLHPEHIQPWLYRIATNLALDAMRRRQRWRWLPLQFFDGRAGADALEPVAERLLVRRVLARLAPDERAVLLLCGLEGFSYPQAALILESSAEAVRKRFQRAKSHFRTLYLALDAAETA